MNRYITKRYVAVCWTEAVRLANLEGTPLRSIRCYHNIELLYRTEWWAWWSDERLTTAIGLPNELRPNRLSADATALMDEVWLSGTRSPQCGWAVLATVDNIVTRKKVRLSDNGEFSRCQEKLTVRLLDGKEHVFYRCCVESCSENCLDNRGLYPCDIVASLGK